MSNREVRDQDGLTWTCAQAYAGLAETPAEEVPTGADGCCEVVCTPSGGAQTVRLTLDTQWQEAMSDDDLLRAIDAARDRSA